MAARCCASSFKSSPFEILFSYMINGSVIVRADEKGRECLNFKDRLTDNLTRNMTRLKKKRRKQQDT